MERAAENFISLTEMHDQGRSDVVKKIWGLWMFSDPAAAEGETKMAETMTKVLVECVQKVEVGAARSGDEDESSEEERGRKRVRQRTRGTKTIDPAGTAAQPRQSHWPL